MRIMGKETAQILDATAGNRTLWTCKDDPRILFIDVEPDLDRKPDLLLDCTNTGFPDARFHTIVFDPPHQTGRAKNEGVFCTPNRREYDAKWPQYKRPGPPRYYGSDKYKNKAELMVFLHKAGKEFSRILSDDGILLLKWGENLAEVGAVLPLFDDFKEVMRTSRVIGRSAKGGVWVLLMKKKGE
jgi:hypothetical protein